MINEDQQLSTHYWLSEFVRSSQYPELADNTLCTDEQITRAKWFCNLIMEPLRAFAGAIVSTCGNRSEYNDKVSTNSNSDHLWRDSTNSLAIDFQCKKLGKAFEWIVKHRTLFKMAYLDMKNNFIHVSMPDDTGIIGKVFIKYGSKKVYL